MKNTLEFAIRMIENLASEDAPRAAAMAVSLHHQEELMGRLDALGAGLVQFAAARAAANDARGALREEREQRESAARIGEIEARTAAEVARDGRAAEEHEVRLAEAVERAERRELNRA